jgi:hypothetical protein
MSSIEPFLPGTPRQLVWVRRLPDGEPKQCYADTLSYAMANDYVPCAAPGEAMPDVDAASVAPDETDQDREQREERERLDADEAARMAQEQGDERGDGDDGEDESLPASGGVDNGSSIMGAPADVTPKTVVDPLDTKASKPAKRSEKRAAAKNVKRK